MSINPAPTTLDRHTGEHTAHQIRQLGRRLHRLRHELITTLTTYDLTGHWALSGAPTCAHWIAHELGICTGTAREWLRVGHALGDLDQISAAFDDQRLSYAKVRELTRVAIDHPDHQTELIGIAERATANDLGRELAAWSAQFEEPATRDRRHHRQRSLTCRTEPDGQRVLTLRLPPLQMGMIEAAIDTDIMTTKRGHNVPAGTSPPPSAADRPTLAQQRADAIVALITNGGATITTEIIIHVRADGCTLDDGTPITATTTERIAPTAFIRTMIHDAESNPINVSGRHRYSTDRQKRVVKERDRVCTDCGSTAFLHHHHEPPYEQTKHTVVAELELKCGSCHRRFHGQ